MDFAEIICEALANSDSDEGLLLLIKLPSSGKKNKNSKDAYDENENQYAYDPFESFGAKRIGGGGGSPGGGGVAQDAILMDNPSQS